MMTRRSMLALLASSAVARPAFGQGISSRGVRAQPRGKPSGRPFAARLTDVAAEAGLTHPIVYGAVDAKSYVLEVVGCGIAFIDYDNDGWLDVFVLCGTRLEGAPPGATNRLYKNNRNGTFTDVTEKAGLTRAGWASAVTVGDYDNDGFDDLFVTYYGHNVLYRNNGDGTFSDVTAKARTSARRRALRVRLHASWITTVTATSISSLRHTSRSISRSCPSLGENVDCKWRGVPVNCGPRGLPPGYVQLFHNNGDGTFTDVSEGVGPGGSVRLLRR